MEGVIGSKGIFLAVLRWSRWGHLTTLEYALILVFILNQDWMKEWCLSGKFDCCIALCCRHLLKFVMVKDGHHLDDANGRAMLLSDES